MVRLLRMLTGLQRASITIVRALPPIRGRGKLAAALSKALLHAGARPLVTTKMNAGHQLVLDMRVPSQLWAAYLGEYDRANLAALLRFVRRGGMALDVGANIGFYAIPLALAGAQVLAFEPVPQNIARLRENVVLNRLDATITIYPIALSSKAGFAEITLREDFEDGGGVGNAAIMIDDGKERFATISVPTVSLDDLLPPIQAGRQLDLIKLDIEGHEDHFLRGARATLRESRPVILMEMNRWYYERRGLNLDELLPTLLPPGYKPHRIARGGGAVPIRTLSEIENAHDVLLVPEDRC